MKTSLPSSVPLMNAAAAEKRIELVKQMREHEVAVVELSTVRDVYQKQGNIYFQTTAQKAKASEQSAIRELRSMFTKTGVDWKLTLKTAVEVNHSFNAKAPTKAT